MKRQIVLGPYTLAEDGVSWLSKESLLEGTVREIEGILYSSSDSDEKYYGIAQQDKVSQTKWTKVSLQ